MNDKQLLTGAGYKALEKQLSDLKEKRWAEVSEKVRKGRSFCDFNEDPEYQKSVDELAALKKKINDLEYIIKQAEIVEDTDTQEVTIGSTVTVKNVSEESKMQFKIVSSAEPNLYENHVTEQSPIGQRLLGHKLNDRVKVTTPSGTMELMITEIE